MYLVVDVEATCWQNPVEHKGESEVIEIGAVLLDPALQACGRVQCFVRPTMNPTLSVFCTELTTIRQEDVDGAKPFPEAIAAFQREAERLGLETLSRMTFCSWGDYDREQMKLECKRNRIEYPFGRHRNLKAEFASQFNLRRPVGMAGALQLLRLPAVGTHHRALDDAANISAIFRLCEKRSRR